MTRYVCLILTYYLVNFSYCINRPVFKIVLTQKGFAQFLQYDIETPAIREFTFCTWFRVFDLSNDQSVFTYVANGNNRVIQMWLDSGGKYMKLSLNRQTSSSILVDVPKNTWRHICLSYQSDFGAWALYLDGRLASCEAARKLHGFILPSGGSVIIGYGIAESGAPTGLEGEIFGANMILKSTIERNHTIKRDPLYQQKLFRKNKIVSNDNSKYIVLNNMTFDSIPDNSVNMKLPISTTTRSFINIKSAHGKIEHDVGLDLIPKLTKSTKDISNEKDIFDIPWTPKNLGKTNDERINFWNLLRETSNIGKIKLHSSNEREQSGSGTQELINVSEYETPPPLRPQSFKDFTRASTQFKKPVLKSFFEIKENDEVFKPPNIKTENEYEVSEVIKPPPLQEKAKVYGQWTSSQFANSVLNYLKNVNFENKKLKKVPSTIPLFKVSDNLPYASDFRVTKVYPPLKIERRNSISNVIDKRVIKLPEINVKIVNDDLRTQILDLHAKTLPKNVEITNRGQSVKNNNYHRFYRNVDNNEISSKITDGANLSKPEPFAAAPIIKSKRTLSDSDLYIKSNLMSILPFLKSAEYFFDEYGDKKYLNNNEMYTKSLLNTNKWHNIKPYNNNYTPRHINMESGEILFTNDKNINSKKGLFKVKYKPDNHKVMKNIQGAEIKHGQALASEISSFSNNNSNLVTLLKYNHGFLSNKNTIKSNNGRVVNKNNFNQHIKIGNALNERFVIGNNEVNNKISFVGGTDTIPDIHRYRSDIDNEKEMVPPSLGPKICKTVELYDRSLYVQPDGSVDVSSILSPVKEKNLAVEFVVQNYKKCSLKESLFEENALILIDWIKTPIRLFGGSYIKKTINLCGFF
ncbi:GATA zinc finger domain-containing protein 4 [Bicyclus anynana]|uniref:GATA zinc finger domain-containing protein 4 n=1 Tax=Bicyclus anynana TaxID=110368 RepID=A0A6J1MFH9_BICAN|nr:GATA zinc finger domain-containing protein 4 [Bicyclus anynana]